jgi:hypothetical protein
VICPPYPLESGLNASRAGAKVNFDSRSRNTASIPADLLYASSSDREVSVKHILAIIALVAFMQQAQAQQYTALPATIKAGTPPAEYDHPYKGNLVITRTADQAETRKLCPVPFPLALALGCTIQNVAGCWVIISPDSVIALAGMTYEFVRRHEIELCGILGDEAIRRRGVPALR